MRFRIFVYQIIVCILGTAFATPDVQRWCGDHSNSTTNYVLNVTTGYGAPDGFARSLLLVNGQTPGPLITAEQGETMAVTVVNRLPVQIGMHWHGLHQRGTPQFDGVPGLNQYAIPPGGNMTYCFGTKDNYGAYWYHVHLRDIYQDGIRGPILINPNDTVDTPYHLVSNDSVDIEAISQAARTSSMLMISDWFHATSEEIASQYAATKDSMRPLCASSVLFNGMGRVSCPPTGNGSDSFGCAAMMSMSTIASSQVPMSTEVPTSMLASDGTPSSFNLTSSMAHASIGPMDGQAMPSGSSSLSSTSMPMPMEAMEKTCVNTTSSLYTYLAPSNMTWFMFHLINAGASQHLAFSIDEHDLWIISADGAFVEPQKVQTVEIAIGQRYGVLVKRPVSARRSYQIRASTMSEQIYQGTAVLEYPNSVDSATESFEAGSQPWINLDGSPLNATVVALDEKSLVPYPRETMPNSNRFLRLDVSQTEPTEWVLQTGQPFASNNGQQTPILFAPREQTGVIKLNKGDIVDVLLQISSDSLDDMAHPIHLHGHYFRVLGSASNSTFPMNMTIQEVAARSNGGGTMTEGVELMTSSMAPRRDTAHLPKAGWLAIRFVADNPGVWLLHCHINSHLTAGMAIAFVEMQDEFPTFADAVIAPPVIAPLVPIL